MVEAERQPKPGCMLRGIRIASSYEEIRQRACACVDEKRPSHGWTAPL
jgi:hypothetical protein